MTFEDFVETDKLLTEVGQGALIQYCLQNDIFAISYLRKKDKDGIRKGMVESATGLKSASGRAPFVEM